MSASEFSKSARQAWAQPTSAMAAASGRGNMARLAMAAWAGGCAVATRSTRSDSCINGDSARIDIAISG